LGVTAPPTPNPPPRALPAGAPAPGAALRNDGSAAEAARHAKRTACLKEAKARKLVGANKNSYIKDCLGNP
jgi:hypothetical protein